MKRFRISVAGLMALVAVIAIDFAVIRAIPRVMISSTRVGLFGALLMAHVLGVYLALVVSSLVRRREVALSRVMFLLFGGIATLLLVTIADLAPYFFWAYINGTAGLLDPPRGQSLGIAGFGMVGIGLIRALLVFGVVTLPLLVPGLLAGWATRGYRLILLKGPEAESDTERASTSEQRTS